ncbi:hypothetical protein ACJIZ3_004921 [Penstemon smallii]|uniref:Transmembrane protein n=1 Tax=Penstemon smallii TaxID=265156 RepID=A0ABD3S3F0_9LAMI
MGELESGNSLHWVKLWEVFEEEEEEDSWWGGGGCVGGGAWGRGGGVEVVGLRAVWVQWRKKAQENSGIRGVVVLSFGCFFWWRGGLFCLFIWFCKYRGEQNRRGGDLFTDKKDAAVPL